MSISEDISLLVQRADTLIDHFDARKASIDAALAAALAAVPESERTYYVDPVSGDDSRTGLTVATAFATLERAVNAASASGVALIYILGDIVLRNYVFSKAQRLQIMGWSAVTNTFTKRKVTVLGTAVNRPTCIAGIEARQGCHIATYSLEISVPVKGATVDYITGVLTPYYGGSIYLSDCTFKADAGANASLVQAWGGTVNAYFSNSFGDASMPGRYFSGVAAGGNPNSYNNGYSYRTNLQTA